MEQSKKRRGGRPPIRQRKPGDRVPLGLRVTFPLKQNLDQAAADSGRSQSQEAELRLERSFFVDDAIPPRLREIGQEWLLAFAGAGIQAARDAGRVDLLKSVGWLENPDYFKAAWLGASAWIMQWAPSLTLEYRRELAEALRQQVDAAIQLEDDEYEKQEATREETQR